jgi:hypothetical protein
VEKGKFGKKQDKEREMHHYLLSSGLTRTLLVKGKWNQRSKLLNKKKGRSRKRTCNGEREEETKFFFLKRKNATAKEKNKADNCWL